MKNFLQKFSTDAINRGSTRDNRDFTTPSRFASHPFKKLKGNLFPNLTVLRSYCLMVFLFIFFLPSSVYSQLYWEGTKEFNDDWGTGETVVLVGNVIVKVAEGKTADFWGEIKGGFSFTKVGPGTVRFLTDNTYTGGTTVAEGTLWIGLNTRGSVVGNIVNNGDLRIAPNDTYTDYTFDGVISGTGSLQKWAEKVTLNGKNTYSGYTLIVQGTLALGATGSIENSYIVNFETSASIAKFDISAGNKKIKALGQGDYNTSNAEVILGNSTLTIGTDGEEDGGGDYAGKITGNGGITKTGGNNLILRGNNTFTGITTVNAGRLTICGNHLSDIVLNTPDCVLFASGVPQTYSGVISGTGFVAKQGVGTLTLNGANTFTGDCHFYDGTIVLGPNGSIENSSSVNLIYANDRNAKLDISAGNKKIKNIQGSGGSEIILGEKTLTIGTAGEEDGGGVHHGAITGSGGISKYGTNTLSLYLDNTYTGTTTINEGCVWIGFKDPTTGNITGNIVNNGDVVFHIGSGMGCGEERTYPGVISGTGSVHLIGGGKLTLTAANTYSGLTSITEGILALSATGSIENSDQIAFPADNGSKFDISAGDKKIKKIRDDNKTNVEISLGSSTLTIDDNGGVHGFSGKFTGTGDVKKIGKGAFRLDGENKTTGKFSLNGGTVYFSNEWAGDFTQAAGTDLAVKGNAIINGTCLLMGGRISMDLTTETPSKLIIMKDASIPGKGKTELNITTNKITDYVLISAKSGLNASSFTLGVPESVAKLTSNDGKQLLFTAYQSILDIETITNDELQITVFPNPTSGEFKVQSSMFKVQSVEIFDVYGRKIYDDSNSYGLTVLRSYDLTPFPAGVYFLKITTENGMVTKKVIKN